MASRSVADLGEVEPDDAVGRAAVVDTPAEQLDRSAVVAFVGSDRFEKIRKPLVGDGAVRNLVDIGALEYPQTIVE